MMLPCHAYVAYAVIDFTLIPLCHGFAAIIFITAFDTLMLYAATLMMMPLLLMLLFALLLMLLLLFQRRQKAFSLMLMMRFFAYAVAMMPFALIIRATIHAATAMRANAMIMPPCYSAVFSPPLDATLIHADC